MKRLKGFTLLEMSIVLAIIGLIVGGIMVGQSLVRAAQIRNVVSEYDTYLKGVKEYQDKYLALPGDDKNAGAIWANTVSGDGSGTIGTSNVTGTTVTDTSPSGTWGEWFLAWQHLSLAGFVPGSFTGKYGAGGQSEAVIGTNVPASKLDGAGWTINYYLNTSGNAGLWSDQYGHLLNFGGYVAGDYTKGAILTPVEALGIDSKLDDGIPGTGKVRAWRSGGGGYALANCTDETVATQAGAIYKTAITSQACALVFLLGF